MLHPTRALFANYFPRFSSFFILLYQSLSFLPSFILSFFPSLVPFFCVFAHLNYNRLYFCPSVSRGLLAFSPVPVLYSTFLFCLFRSSESVFHSSRKTITADSTERRRNEVIPIPFRFSSISIRFPKFFPFSYCPCLFARAFLSTSVISAYFLFLLQPSRHSCSFVNQHRISLSVRRRCIQGIQRITNRQTGKKPISKSGKA